MEQQQLAAEFCNTHQQLIDFVCALDDEQFILSANGKWTPGQQLAHVLLCIKPIAQALASKDYIKGKFGFIDRAHGSREQLVGKYKAGLANGGKAPDRFVPEVVTTGQRQEIVAGMTETLNIISQLLGSYTEEELGTLTMPHPFLGLLTIREMMWLMTDHATHHMHQTKINLETAVSA